MTTAIEVYTAGLLDGVPVNVHVEGGGSADLPLARWRAEHVSGDETILDRCVGPVLDVGCGPGRLAAALARRGVPALGIDIAPAAVLLARRAGAVALPRSVFERVPGTGRWARLLLADGNIGIGGDPLRLLCRVRELLAPGGTALVEVEPPRTRSRTVRLRLSTADAVSEWFPWARVSADAIGRLGDAAGLAVREVWRGGGRWFAALAPR